MFYTGYSVERAQYKRYKQQAISLKCIVHRSEQHCVVYGYKQRVTQNVMSTRFTNNNATYAVYTSNQSKRPIQC